MPVSVRLGVRAAAGQQLGAAERSHSANHCGRQFESKMINSPRSVATDYKIGAINLDALTLSLISTATDERQLRQLASARPFVNNTNASTAVH